MKKLLKGILVFVIGLFCVFSASFFVGAPMESYIFSITVSIIYLASIIYIKLK